MNRIPVEPDVGLPDLVRRLTDDSKRLLSDEVRLAKLEMKDNLKRGGRGATWLGVAFGTGVVALAAFTISLATLIGRVVNDHMWLGAMVTGVLEIVVAAVVFKRGVSAFAEPSYTLGQTRESIKETSGWVATVRER